MSADDTMAATIRHKGRTYTVSALNIERGGEVLHRIEIVASPTGRNVRIWLDGELLAPVRD